MKCGNCGNDKFEIATGKCFCKSCNAEVDNEVAAAIHTGFAEEYIKAVDIEAAMLHKGEMITSSKTAEESDDST